MSEYDYTFKLMMLGDASVDKTSLILRYISGYFMQDLRLTLGVDFYSKTTKFNGRTVKLQIWDFGGEERFRFLLSQYSKGAHGAFFLYDITNPMSLEHLTDWTQIVRENAGDIPILLIGSKLHLEEHRMISRQKAISIAEENNMSAFVEVSAEENINVDDAFKTLTELIMGNTEFRESLVPLQFTPIKIKPEFKINEFLEIRLENGKTNIYVGGRLFNTCKYLLLNLTKAETNILGQIDSVDQAAEYLDRSMEREYKNDIFSEIEFWGHCSNLQAWHENNYDTRILHRNLAFPLLKALVDVGDILAKRKFKEEIAYRIESGYPSVVMFLVNQGYLNYLTEEEVETILSNPKFLRNVPKWLNTFKDIPEWFDTKIRAIFNDLKCPYCNIKINKRKIQRILKGESLSCELCYSDLL